MGAWSHESFGNDEACDWLADLREGSDLRPAEAAFDEVLTVGGGNLEARQAVEAIAAAEVLARILGRFGVRDAYSERIDAWVTQVRLKPSPDLISKARRALDRVLVVPSELMELWEEDGEPSDWRAAVNDLRGRISD